MAIPKMETLKKASELTGLTVYCITNLCKTGKIVYIRSGRKYLVNMDSLEAFMRVGDGGQA